MSQILQQIYMTGGDVYLGVIEMYSDAWPDRIVLVADFVGHTVITEDGITLNALPSGLAVSLPKRDATGAQNLTFALDGVRPEATRLLRAAESAQEQINLTYRTYLYSDLTEPAEAPYHLIVRSFTAQSNHIEVTAGLFDLIDMRWPRLLYNSNTAPCLKYQQ